MQVENLKLSHEILEPEPTDFKRFLFFFMSLTFLLHSKNLPIYRPSHSKSSGSHQTWSGDATKGRGFGDNSTDMKITIGDNNEDKG